MFLNASERRQCSSRLDAKPFYFCKTWQPIQEHNRPAVMGSCWEDSFCVAVLTDKAEGCNFLLEKWRAEQCKCTVQQQRFSSSTTAACSP